MSKFKVGDKVRIKENLPNNVDGLWVCADMKSMGGQIVTIDAACECGQYYIKEDSKHYCWSDNMFELANPKEMLRTGMIIENRSGVRRRVYMNVSCYRGEEVRDVFVSDDGTWGDIADYDDQLCPIDNAGNASELDVMTIYLPARISTLIQSPDEALVGAVVWERKEPKEMTVAQIEEILGYPIKVVRE